ncbi:MAG: hypothetical protein GX557_15735 [Chloroflexi bacterium]|nr:hypothetical protein [Chloroflexota bacterium]
MADWRLQLTHDPVPALLSAGDEALTFFVRRDLSGEDAGTVESLWALPDAKRILRAQLPDGSWRKRGPAKHAAINDALIETWRQLRVLVAQYGFARENPLAAAAAEYLFSCQTKEGDIRGMLANQYATYYTGAILATLIEAGYADDVRVSRGLEWLLSMRQTDGAWSVPMITFTLDRETQYRLASEFAEPLQPDRSKPFSHNATGMVLRAFAAHPTYRRSQEARHAAGLLASRFFQPDAYTSYHDAGYWVRFEYPFWWNNLVAALDSVTLIGLSREEEPVQRALQWLREHQEADGLWKVSYKPHPERADAARARTMRPWIGLAICRVYARLYA